MEHSEADCREILSRLYLYIDGEAGGNDCVVIESHLSDCGHCFEYAEFERAVKEVIARKCKERAAPSHIVEQLRMRLREEH